MPAQCLLKPTLALPRVPAGPRRQRHYRHGLPCVWKEDVKLGEVLGQGASGVVYKGRLHPEGRPVAVKVLNVSVSKHPAQASSQCVSAQRSSTGGRGSQGSRCCTRLVP